MVDATFTWWQGLKKLLRFMMVFLITKIIICEARHQNCALTVSLMMLIALHSMNMKRYVHVVDITRRMLVGIKFNYFNSSVSIYYLQHINQFGREN